MILDACENTIRDVLLTLLAEERLACSRVNEKLLATMVGGRATPSRICRLCDAVGWGHYEGRCSVTEVARELAEV